MIAVAMDNVHHVRRLNLSMLAFANWHETQSLAEADVISFVGTV